MCRISLHVAQWSNYFRSSWRYDYSTIWIYLVDVREGQRHPVTTGTDELAGTVQEKLRRKEPKSLR